MHCFADLKAFKPAARDLSVFCGDISSKEQTWAPCGKKILSEYITDRFADVWVYRADAYLRTPSTSVFIP